MFKKVVFVLFLTGCSLTKPAPELDPIKVQTAFKVIEEHIKYIEIKLKELEEKGIKK